MKSQEEILHIDYEIKCNLNSLTEEEKDLLINRGSWLSALTSGQCMPETDEQKEFIINCNLFRSLSAEEMVDYLSTCKDKINKFQFIWLKYIAILKHEKENPNNGSGNRIADMGFSGTSSSAGGSGWLYGLRE